MTVSENILAVLMEVERNQDLIVFSLSLCAGCVCGLAFILGFR